MTKRMWMLGAIVAMVAGCGGAVHHADEPTLAARARPLSEQAPASAELASACDRSVWSFRPAQAGRYRFEAQSDVPVSLRLFSTNPDLYLETGRTEGGTARIESTLDPDTTYAVTMASTECRPAHVAMSVARSD